MKYSTCTLAPAHMEPMSRGLAQRSLSGMKSIPCCSTWSASSASGSWMIATSSESPR